MNRNTLLTIMLCAMLAVVGPGYFLTVKAAAAQLLCEVRDRILTEHETSVSKDQLIAWHLEFVRADGVTIYDHRHRCR